MSQMISIVFCCDIGFVLLIDIVIFEFMRAIP